MIQYKILKDDNIKYEFTHAAKHLNGSKYIAWYYANSTPYLQALEIVKDAPRAAALAVIYSGVSIVISGKKFSRLPRLYFPLQHPCMPLHFKRTFFWWLQQLNQQHPMPRHHIQQKLCRWADYLHYKEVWKQHCRRLEKRKAAKLHHLPQELRNRIYAFVLYDETPANLPYYSVLLHRP